MKIKKLHFWGDDAAGESSTCVWKVEVTSEIRPNGNLSSPHNKHMPSFIISLFVDGYGSNRFPSQAHMQCNTHTDQIKHILKYTAENR